MNSLTGKTHVTAGILGTTIIAAWFGGVIVFLDSEVITYIMILSSPLGSLMTDIDHHNSTITNKVKPIGKMFRLASVKHRGFFHSIWPVIGMNLGSVALTEFLTSESNMFYTLGFLSAYSLIFILLVVFRKLPRFSNIIYAFLALPIIMLATVFMTDTTVHTVLLSFLYGINLGYALHILFDMMNPRGVRLLWPLDWYINFPITVITGSSGEKNIIILMNMILVGIVLYKIGGIYGLY